MVSRCDDYAARRRWDKAPFLTANSFDLVRGGRDARIQPVDSPWRVVKTPHAAIDRLSDCTGGDHREAGRFYQTEGLSLEDDPCVHVYLRSLPAWEDEVQRWLAELGRVGFGRDKSQGFGQISVEAFEPWDGFAALQNPNAFVSLSSMVPAASDPTDGRWRLRLKRGCLGEHAFGNPFKRPLLQMEPGTVFRVGPEAIRPFYGRTVAGIAPGMTSAVQCGLTISVPCRWNSADENEASNLD